ncbi:MAG: hypothetical protein CM15mP58_22020 [Burkholderiaceae bacterium]|nr:MAG: hypothetical protein CM15mP58_22020 [Burkholderiaceae bacterium]
MFFIFLILEVLVFKIVGMFYGAKGKFDKLLSVVNYGIKGQ